jgi:hypothetical protein
MEKEKFSYPTNSKIGCRKSADAENRKVSYLSNGAERLGSRKKPESVLTTFEISAFSPGFSRSAICRFTRSINTTSFFDSWSLSACLHIFWKSCGA